MQHKSHVHFGLALGIATAGVILALGGCAITSQPDSGKTATPSVALEQFSADEQARILAVQDIVAKAAAEHQVDPSLLNAMIWVESRFDPKAKSPSGARGLMQLMPATAAYLAKRMGEASAHAYDPEFNVRAGALYLAEMQSKFGDEQLAVAAYHAGPGNVKKWVEAKQKFPEYSDDYVAKVMSARERFSGAPVQGRSSGARTAVVTPSSTEREPSPTVVAAATVAAVVDHADDELEVPDVSTLPDAAEIHGVPRVVYEGGEDVPEPDPDPEVVFEVHPELDRNPAKPPPGWRTASAEQPKPRTRPRPRPRPNPTPEAKPEPEPEFGIGVLPDL